MPDVLDDLYRACVQVDFAQLLDKSGTYALSQQAQPLEQSSWENRLLQQLQMGLHCVAAAAQVAWELPPRAAYDAELARL